MEFFDSHAHYNDEKFDADLEDVLYKIQEAGVTKVITAGYNLQSSKKAIELAEKYNFMYATCGVSPNDISENFEKEINEIENMAKSSKKVVAIGEIGLDYYWNKENKLEQQNAFIEQIKIANKLNLPIVIHSRDAYKDTIEVIKNKMPAIKKGVFHCSQQNLELIKEALNLDYYISFAGAYTFKNAKQADDVIKIVPTQKMLIETDSPYLAPEPKRGTRNDSSNLIYIAQKVASAKQISVEEVAKYTYNNAKTLFSI